MLQPEPGSRNWNLVAGFAVLWLMVIAWCTLRPEPAQAIEVGRLPWYCIVCGDSGAADVLLNLLLFLPLGFALRVLGWRWWLTLAVAAALSLAIELIQGRFLVGRDACLGDVLSNSFGALLGSASMPLALAIIRPTRTFAARSGVIILASMTGIWFITGNALQPSLTDIRWIGQPMSETRGKQPFPGTLDRTSFNGIAIPNDAMVAHPVWRDSITLEVAATRATGEIFRLPIVMLRIIDTALAVQVAMDQVGDDARLRIRLRAADWLLHTPRWRLTHAMQMNPGEPWRFRWRWYRNRFTVENGPVAGTASLVTVPLSIGLGWALIHPFVTVVGDSRLLWTALWLAAWFGLLGWLAGVFDVRIIVLTGVIAVGLMTASSAWWGFTPQANELLIAAGAYLTLSAASAARTAR